jgi:hypothetical protein
MEKRLLFSILVLSSILAAPPAAALGGYTVTLLQMSPARKSMTAVSFAILSAGAHPSPPEGKGVGWHGRGVTGVSARRGVVAGDEHHDADYHDEIPPIFHLCIFIPVFCLKCSILGSGTRTFSILYAAILIALTLKSITRYPCLKNTSGTPQPTQLTQEEQPYPESDQNNPATGSHDVLIFSYSSRRAISSNNPNTKKRCQHPCPKEQQKREILHRAID